jgi:hypothetical protein
MILDMALVPFVTHSFLHTGATGMTERHHANDHAKKGINPPSETQYGEKSLPNG